MSLLSDIRTSKLVEALEESAHDYVVLILEQQDFISPSNKEIPSEVMWPKKTVASEVISRIRSFA